MVPARKSTEEILAENPIWVEAGTRNWEDERHSGINTVIRQATSPEARWALRQIGILPDTRRGERL